MRCSLLTALPRYRFPGRIAISGYSFTSQTISELAAIGAPSKPFVDPLFTVYGLLVVAFGIGVLLTPAGRRGAFRITGVVLIAYGAIGLASSLFGSFFAMEQRGAGSLTTDAPHLILTGVLVLLLLAAIGFGGAALGGGFRVYSFVTLLTVVAFGALTIPHARQIALGQPTPGLGVIERVDLYSALLWLAMLGIALLPHDDDAVQEGW